MENASKALIMAGTVLIAIMIISLGVMIFKNFSGSATKMANLDEQQISAFNAKITPYIGNNVSGSQVNALIELARTINADATSTGEEMKFIEILNASGLEILKKGQTSAPSRVTTGVFYTVKGDYDDNGLITTITVTQN